MAEAGASAGDGAGRTVPPKRQATGGGNVLALAYLVIWVVILVVFKKVYTKYLSKSGRKKSWFGKHSERDAYESLLQTDPDNDEMLRKALVKRAMSDIRRMRTLAEEKDSVYNLMRAGSISEEMWTEFKQAEQELTLEIYDLQAEAETFKRGWADNVLKEAAELVDKEDALRMLMQKKDQEEKRGREEQKRAQRQKEHETRVLREQEERARRMTEKYLSTRDN